MTDQEYDIVIVGAGTAGMACAITAAERGLKICVVEKTDYVGGALHWSGGHMSAGGTRIQQRKGIEDSPEQHLADIHRINGKSGNLAVTSLAVKEAPHTINWLEDIGFEFAPECPRIIYGHIAYETPRTIYGPEKAMSIYKVLKPLWDDHVTQGTIHCFFEHELIGLGKTHDRFDTVICNTVTGKKSITGKHIVMTTGGYGSNPAYFKKKHPETPLVSSCYPTATADGHQVLEENGAVFGMQEYHLPSLGGIELEKDSGRCDFNKAWAMVLTSVYRQPRDIYINTLGKRFIAEDEVNPETREHAVMQQPDWYFWVLFDETALNAKDENGNPNPIIIGWTVSQIKAEAAREVSLFSAATIDALAAKTALPVATLTKTIAQYNEDVEAGREDRHFGRTYMKDTIKEAPFYALKVHASVLVTFGGIQVNEALQVLDAQGQPMNGLYAAGELLGLGATSGSSFCSGMAITPALSFGRILGRSL